MRTFASQVPTVLMNSSLQESMTNPSRLKYSLIDGDQRAPHFFDLSIGELQRIWANIYIKADAVYSFCGEMCYQGYSCTYYLTNRSITTISQERIVSEAITHFRHPGTRALLNSS